MSAAPKLVPAAEPPAAVVSTGPHVYSAIAAVMGALASEGIAKDRRNTQGSGYNFRGIDDIYNALSRCLADNRLVIVPRVLSRECVERSSKSGGNLFYTVVDAEFDLISAVDGSIHTARTVGEAMDSGDKSSNKAMSAAYKYMAFQTFCIPTEGDNDADSSTHEVAPPAKPEPPAAPPTLSERADRLESTLLSVKTGADLDKAYALGSALCAELDAKDPERLALVEATYKACQERLSAAVSA